MRMEKYQLYESRKKSERSMQDQRRVNTSLWGLQQTNGNSGHDIKTRNRERQVRAAASQTANSVEEVHDSQSIE